MKNIEKSAIILTVSIILCLTATAQDNFSEGKYTVDGRIFETTFSDIYANRMTVDSKLPQYKEGYPWPEGPNLPLMVLRSDMKVDTVIDRKIIYEVLEDKLENLKANGEELTVRYAFGPDGDVVDISSFSLARNTLITPQELALIDKRLRKEVRASFKGPDYRNWKVIPFVRELHF
ncbi:hypothetical protein [Albibacterium profundi]|uniref:TonB C-terminal domain-containing protein n=1 Tax=Albibacterium profundi TaxID=3134906 RepID=A0ABV5CE49_9SPHI